MIDLDLPIVAYALSGGAPGLAPAERTCALPPAAFHPRRARLPGLAVDMARRTVDAALARGLETGAAPPPADRIAGLVEAVLFGTALGGMTETAAFIDRMVLDREESPLPRAFSDSVLNAPASRIAMALQARGECQTFVQGAASFAHALFAAACRWRRGERGGVIVAGADEVTPYVQEAIAACQADLCDYAPLVADGPPGVPPEGGAALLCGLLGAGSPQAEGVGSEVTGASDAPGRAGVTPIATLRRVAIGRPKEVEPWLRRVLTSDDPTRPIDLVLADGSLRRAVQRALGASGAPCHPIEAWTGAHPSRGALAAALAVGLLCGEATFLDLAAPPRAIAIVNASWWGDVGAIVLSCPTSTSPRDGLEAWSR